MIRNRRWKLVAAVASCLALVVGCGSQVPPSKFVNAQGGLVAANGSVVPGVVNPSGGVVVPGSTSSGATNPGVIGNGGTGNGNGGTGNGNGGTGNGNVGSGNNGGTGGSGSSGSSGPLSGVKVGSCAGFQNSKGITDSTITIANVSDLSGPVPNLFKSAQAAVTAYVAYFNSTSSICGRKLKLIGLDSGTSESGDQQASQSACDGSFAMVGSMGAFDAGGADTVTHCGIPDIRAASTETTRQKAPVSFGAYSLNTSEIPTSPFTYFKSLGDAYKHAAFVYLNAGASSLNASSFIAGETKMGYSFKDKIAIDVQSVPNYDSIVTTLKHDGIKYVQYIGAYQYAQRLKSAMYQQNYNPIYVMDPVAYDANYVSTGDAVNGTYIFNAGPLFEEANKNPELATYISWLNRTSGGVPTFFGTYAWVAASLFVKIAAELGGKLSRSTMLSALRAVHNYTDHNMVGPQDIAGKHTPKCLSVIKLQNGKWVRKTPYPYTCGSYVDSGVG